MLLNPSILALILVSSVVGALLLLASGFSTQVLRHWDISSGSELQLKLERRTYLIATILVYCFVAELIALLLFVYNAEQLSGRFVGAMCATGVLNVNAWGWPTLFLKIIVFFIGAAWLMLNRVDNKASDYPLVRVKYWLLLLTLPLAVAEWFTQLQFFLNMNADVITSCCGSLFTPEGEGMAAVVAALTPQTALLLMILSAISTVLIGFWVLRLRAGGLVFAVSSAVAFIVALIAIVSLVALYIYEHPHHHCPFCILKSGHGFVGYALYLPLFIATALALSAGAIAPFRRIPSLTQIIQTESHHVIIASMLSMLVFYAVAAVAIMTSNLTMTGVWW